MNTAAPSPLIAATTEAERLALLGATQLLDAAPPPALQALVRQAALTCGCPVAQVNLVDAHRLYALARHGHAPRHASREGSWCAQTIEGDDALVILDTQGIRPAASPAQPPAWRFYAGVPLRVEGLALGTLCVLDTLPHALTDAEIHALVGTLADLAEGCAALLAAQLDHHRFKKQEARIRTASLTGADWLWETDERGCIQWVSASLMQHTGLDPVAEIGLRARDIYTPRNDHTRASWDRYQLARERREPFTDAIADRITPRGPITVCISGTPVFDTRGQFMGYRGSSRNITRQIELEQKTQYQDALLRQAFDAMQGGVMISDPEGRIVQANRRWRELTGIADIELAPAWPELVRQLIDAGIYPEALGREEEFFHWRMNMVEQDQPVPLRLRDAVVLSRDLRLADGSTVHFSTDISHSQHEAVTLQEVLQADLSLGLLVIDAQAQGQPLVYINAGGEHMLKATKSQLLDQPLLSCIDALQPTPQGRTQLAQALQSSSPSVMLLTTHTEQGDQRTLEWRLTPLQDQSGRVIHIMGLLQDVTDRQAAAEKLRVSEELYRCVAATISDGLLVVQLDGTLVAINPAGGRILGLSREQANGLCGQPLHIELLQDDLSMPLPADQAPWWRAIKTGLRVVNQVCPLRRADGELAWVQISSHQLAISAGSQPFAVVATLRDITQERASAQALARSEERWKFALEGAGDGVWDWSVNQGVVFRSVRCKTLLGYDEAASDDDIGDWSERIHPDDRADALQAFEDYCHDGTGIFQREMRVQHRLGHYIWVLSRGKVVRRDEDERPVRVVGTHSDITPLKEAERALRDKQSAELASRAKSEFLSRMSHEIRTPLNAVRGFAQLLDLRLDPAVTPDAVDYVRQILVSSELLSDLVNEVLDLQQIETGALTLHRDTVVLAEVAQVCTTMLEPLSARHQVALQCHVQPQWRVCTDKRRLGQVLSNLISNAIKYNRPGGIVRVAAEAAEDAAEMVLTIEDTGLGMAPEQLAKLFQPFERLGRDTSPIEGTGLGLIITKSLVEAMGGRLEIRSQPGIGTRVTVTLPQADAVPPEAAPLSVPAREPHAVNETLSPYPHPLSLASTLSSPLAAPQAAANTAVTHLTDPAALPQHPQGPPCSEHMPLRVMYVEDNRINALLFEEALRPYPELKLEVAEDGQAALAVARQHHPDVLVIDAHLPGMSGFEVLRALRTVPGQEHTPAYMCSADALPEDISRAHAEGFVGYWTKPIDIQMVTHALCQLAQQGRIAR